MSEPGCAYTGFYAHREGDTVDMTRISNILAAAMLLAAASAACAQAPACPPPDGVALQVLGSGGPIADDARASTGYIVWVDGKSRVLVDAGGGTFLRFGEAGASFPDLDFVGLSHFHTDHSADFPALLKSGNFSGRERPLPVAGPGPGGPFPGLGAWLDSLLAPGEGAYHYLAGYLDGSGKLARLEQREVGIDVTEPVRVHDGDVTVDALPVPHGIVPALGFRVTAAGKSIVFASDQNGSSDAFTAFAKGASVLVMHLPIPEGATGNALKLHARPSRVAGIAAEAGAGTLVLSHFMARSLQDLDANVEVVRSSYDGEVVIADDLACLVVNGQD
jgi:ribonuclease BN (tRNA processing enzyme)